MGHGPKCSLSSRITSIFIIATSVGAQVVKIPVAAYIETYPMTLMWVLAISTSAIITFFLTSKMTLFVSEYLLQRRNRLSREESPSGSDVATTLLSI